MNLNQKATRLKRIFRILFLLYCIAIILIAILPINGEPSSLNNMYVVKIRLDYLFHSLVFLPFLPFAIFTITLPSKNQNRIICTLSIIIIGIVFALFTEVIQHFLNYRTFNINDLLANTAGVLLGLPICLWAKQKFKTKIF